MKTSLPNKWSKADACVRRLQSKFTSDGFDVQVLNFTDSLIFQCRNCGVTTGGVGNFFKKATGLGTVATLKLTRVGQNDLEIECTGGKWMDKAAVMGVSMIVLWPLFVTSSIGMLKQNQLVSKVYDAALVALSE